MTIKQIIGFNVLAKTLNFSKAAESTYMTQPAFSRMIQSLEEELGGQLFLRSKTAPKLSPLGEQVYPELLSIQRSYENIIERVSGYKDINRTNSIAFGTFESSLPDAVYKLCSDFSKQSNQPIYFRYPEYSESTIFDALKKQDIDMVYTGHIPEYLSEEVEALTLETQAPCVYMNAFHPLAERDGIHLRELINETFVVVDRERSPYGFNRLLEMTLNAKFAPKRFVQSSTLPGIVNHLRGGEGIAVLPSGVLSAHGLRVIPILDVGDESMQLLWMKTPKNPIVKEFVSFCRQFLALTEET